MVRGARGERELDQGSEAGAQSRSVELSSVHRQPVQVADARGGLLAYGRITQEARSSWRSADAARYPEISTHKGRRQGTLTAEQSTAAPRLRTSRATTTLERSRE